MKEKTGEREKVSIKRLEALPPHDLKLLLSVRKSPETRLTNNEKVSGNETGNETGNESGNETGKEYGNETGKARLTNDEKVGYESLGMYKLGYSG